MQTAKGVMTKRGIREIEVVMKLKIRYNCLRAVRFANHSQTVIGQI